MFGARCSAPVVVWLAGLWLVAGGVRAGEVERRLAAMDLEARVGQLFLVSLPDGELDAAERAWLRRVRPGGVLVFRRNAGGPARLARWTNALQAAARPGLGLLLAVDLEGGAVSRLPAAAGFVHFPPAMLVGATDQPAWAERLGRAMGRQLAAVGINMELAPVADLLGAAPNPVIGRRAFGSDPQRVGRLVAGFVRGCQRAGVAAVVKHFPGHGATATDSHHALAAVQRSRRELRRRELVPFAHGLRAGVGAVMVGHLWLAGLEPGRRRPASLSPLAIHGLLRGELGFSGPVMTDALDMKAVAGEHDLAAAALLALKAGADLLALGAAPTLEQQAAAVAALRRAVADGRLPAARVARSVRRILKLKQRFGLLRPEPVDPAAAAERVRAAAPAGLLAELAAAGITRVRDRRGLVPLAPDRRALLLVPPGLGDFGRACAGRSPALELAVLPAEAGEEDAALRARVAGFARLVLVAAAAGALERWAALLPAERLVVAAVGSPLALRAAPPAAAWLAAYSDAPAVLGALCDVLLGLRSARGRLPLELAVSADGAGEGE